MKILSPRLVLALLIAGAPAAAQSPVAELRVVGEHALAKTDAPDAGKQLALVDARSKATAQVVARLQDRAEIKALHLTPLQTSAYVAAILETEEQSTRTITAKRQSVVQTNVRVRPDADEAARRVVGLHRDQEASEALIDAWKEVRGLEERLGEQRRRLERAASGGAGEIAAERQKTLLALEAAELGAQATAALAKTEESPAGGRAPSSAGRERAKQLAESAVALSPGSARAHLAMGDVLVDARQTQAAEAEYRNALNLQPDSDLAHIKLGTALRLQGKSQEAAAELRGVLRTNPDSARAHSDLAFVLRSQRNVAEAISEYKEALRLNPDLVDAHNGLAITFASQQRVLEGIAEFREIVRIDPDSTVGYYNLAVALADTDQDEESAIALREVVRINPNHYNAHYNLGELFRLEAKFDDSASQFREFLRLAPATPANQRNIQRAKNFVQMFENP